MRINIDSMLYLFVFNIFNNDVTSNVVKTTYDTKKTIIKGTIFTLLKYRYIEIKISDTNNLIPDNIINLVENLIIFSLATFINV